MCLANGGLNSENENKTFVTWVINNLAYRFLYSGSYDKQFSYLVILKYFDVVTIIGYRCLNLQKKIRGLF